MSATLRESEHPSEDRIDELRRSLEGMIGVPATEGNQVEVLKNGDRIFPAMLEAIADAEHTIDFLTFVYWTGPIAQEFAIAGAAAALAVSFIVLALAWRTPRFDAATKGRLVPQWWPGFAPTTLRPTDRPTAVATDRSGCAPASFSGSSAAGSVLVVAPPARAAANM